MLHQDPRFFQESDGTFLHRTGYAISRILSPAPIRGISNSISLRFAAVRPRAAISTYSYHPSADRTLPNMASVWGTQVGYDTLTYVVKEFWPDIRRKLSKKKQPPLAN